MDAPTDPPLPLNTEARRFWDRHAERLRAVGLLTAADADSFAVLCVIWSKLAALSSTEPGEGQFREMVQLNQLGKQYHAYAAQFGLLPKDRQRNKLAGEPPPAKDKFGL